MKKVFASILVIALISALFLSGCSSNDNSKENSEKSEVTYDVDLAFMPTGALSTNAILINSAMNIIETRLDLRGIKEHIVLYDESSNTINVKFNNPNDNDYDEDEIAEYLSNQALLTFRPGNSYKNTEMDSDGNLVYKTPIEETEVVLMDGSMVRKAEADINNSYNGIINNVVKVYFTDEGTELFKDITNEYKGKIISIWIDDKMITAPTVNSVISDGTAIIEGVFTAESAQDLANQIMSGSLPIALDRVE